eukprot:gene20370-27139_t
MQHPAVLRSMRALLWAALVASTAAQYRQPGEAVLMAYPDSRLLDVPASFLGISVEPLNQAQYYVNGSVYMKLIGNLAQFDSGPFSIRWGGNAQDRQTEVLDKNTWGALNQLYEETGCQYIVGLNLRISDPDLAYDQMRECYRTLPPEAIYAIEIGNEPDLYHLSNPEPEVELIAPALINKKKNKKKNKKSKNKNKPPPPNPPSAPRIYNETVYKGASWTESYAQREYWDDLDAYYYKLGRMVRHMYDDTKLFTAPAVANFESWSTGDIRQHGEGSRTKDYSKMVTAHYYTGKSADPDSSVDTILLEDETTDPGSSVDSIMLEDEVRHAS